MSVEKTDSEKSPYNTDYQFIYDNFKSDIHKLYLKYPLKRFEVSQIESRHRFAKKFPNFIENHKFLFPTVLSGEQATDEKISEFHASLIQPNCSVLDMTSGLGIDILTIARKSNKCIALDIELIKTETLIHNADILSIDNIEVINKDCISYLAECNDKFDYIFVDPARRDALGGRIYSLKDSLPDVVSNLHLLMSHSNTVIIKASPMLDIKAVATEIPEAVAIMAVCYNNECKELLIIAGKSEYKGTYAVNIENGKIDILPVGNNPVHEIQLSNTNVSDLIGKYIYQPNAAMMKFKDSGYLFAKFSEIKKMSSDCQLYVSSILYEDFPGTRYQITAVADKKYLKTHKGKKLNVISRNYPLSAPDIENKYKLISGGDKYLIACRLNNIPTLLEAIRI